MSAAQASPTGALRILVVEHDAGSAQVLGRGLAEAGASAPRVTVAISGRRAMEALRREGCDALIVGLDAIGDIAAGVEEAVGRLVRLAEGAIVVALSDGHSVTASLAALSGGAHDCLTRPVGGRALATRLSELAERHGRAGAGAFLAGRATLDAGLHGLVGQSSQMQVVFEQISRMAGSGAPVFITGEAGTGKTLAAEALHRAGPQAERPLVRLGAAGTRDRELDGAGAVLVDEIADLDISAQGDLLALIDREGEGGPRVICATRHSPLELIAARRFREDLFYRLHVLPLNLPPLRQRSGDAALLARHFLARFSAEEGKTFTGFSGDALARLATRDWPGNVRQLAALIRRVVVIEAGGEITAGMIDTADDDRHSAAEGRDALTGAILPMWRQEQRIIEDAIARCNGNIALAAQALELSPSTIYRKRQAWAEFEAQGAA